MKIYGKNCGNYENLAHHVVMSLGLVDFYTLDRIKEYFKNNIPVFSTHSYSYESNGIIEYHFDDSASSYVMRTKDSFYKIKFLLEDPVSVLEALDNNQELILFFRESNSLNDKPYDRTYFKKQYINDKGAFHEDFFPDGNYAGSVVTKIYDREELRNAILQVEEAYPGLTVISNMSFVSDVAKKAGLKPKRIIRVFNVHDDGYWAIESDSDDNEISRQKTSGHYLYDAYYNYMVKQGLFTSYGEKEEIFSRKGK